jgi:hypothetical protein
MAVYKIFACTFFLVIILWQGGFSDISWYFSGLFATISLLFSSCFFKIPKFYLLAISLFLLSSVTAALSSAYGDITGVIKTCVFVMLFLLLLPIKNAESNAGAKKSAKNIKNIKKINLDTEKLILLSGLIVSILGILAFCQILPLQGNVLNNRLYGIFQYANATGIFIAITAFFTRFSPNKAKYTVLMETALILTQSIGSIGTYLIFSVLWSVLKKDKNSAIYLFSFSLSACLAVLIFITVSFTQLPFISVIFPLVYFLLAPKTEKLFAKIWGNKIFLPTGLLLVALFGVSLLLVRKMQPLATFVERLVHISDGFRMLSAHPLGLGGNAWKEHIHEFQTQWYIAKIPHSSLIQLGFLAGFLGIFVVVVALVYFLKTSIKNKNTNHYFFASLMILFHSLQDITFSFVSIVFLFLLCLANSEFFTGDFPNLLFLEKGESGVRGEAPSSWGQRPHTPITIFRKRVGFRKLLTAVTAENTNEKAIFANKSKIWLVKLLYVIPCALFVTFLIPEAMKNRANYLANTGNFPASLSLLENTLTTTGEILLLRMKYAVACEDYDAFDRAFDKMRVNNAQSYYYKTIKHIKLEEYDQATESALKCMEKAPYWQEAHDLYAEIEKANSENSETKTD